MAYHDGRTVGCETDLAVEQLLGAAPHARQRHDEVDRHLVKVEQREPIAVVALIDRKQIGAQMFLKIESLLARRLLVRLKLWKVLQ